MRNLASFRNQLIDGVKPHDEGWLWPVGDRGLWSGPDDDWNIIVKPNILQHVPSRRVVVQAGGGCGMYPYLLSMLFERVYTFEPDPLNFYCMTYNCPSELIFKINAGVDSTNGLLSVNTSDEANRGTNIFSKDGVGTIPSFKIDQLQLPVCDLLQLDVEGYELHALDGARDTILRCNPVIITELDSADVENFMTSYGYNRGPSERQNTFWIK